MELLYVLIFIGVFLLGYLPWVIRGALLTYFAQKRAYERYRQIIKENDQNGKV